MKKMKRLFVLLCSLFLMANSFSQDSINIGLCMANFGVERWLKDMNSFIESANKLGARVIAKDANDDQATQNEQALKLLKQGIDILVVIPIDAGQAKVIVEKARATKTPVISYDRLITGCDLDLYVSFDNEKVGTYMTEYVTKKKASGNFVILNGPLSDNNSILINQGIRKILDPLVNEEKVTILADIFLTEWTSIAAFNEMQTILENNKQIDVIITSFDDLAMGSLMALDMFLGGEYSVILTGQDATIDACRNILNGQQTMTIYKPVTKLAEVCADLAVKMVKGKEFDRKTQKINNGFTDVTSVLLEPIPVDSTNIFSTVIADGFQKMEDIEE